MHGPVDATKDNAETRPVLAHAPEAGPLATFMTKAEAEAALEAVLEDEPAWVGDVWVEPFEFGVAGHLNS